MMIRGFSTTICLLFLVSCPAFTSGCRWGKPFIPLTPSQLRSGELSRLGNAALEKGNWDEAEKKLEEAVKLNKKDTELRRHYAEALWIQGKWKESLEQLSEAAKRGGTEDASLYMSLAEKYLAMNDPTTAARYSEEAIRLAGQDFKAWALRAKANWFLAEQEFRNDSSPETPETTTRFLVRARDDYYRALSLSPNNREILPELAAVQMLCGQPEHALATWQNLQELFPPDAVPADLLRGKAEAYIALHRTDEALEALQVARVREPNHPEIDRRLREVTAMIQGRIL